MNPERMDRYPIYLHINSEDEYIQIDDFGLDFKDTMIGVFDVSGNIGFKEGSNLTEAQKTLYLCSDLCGDASILNKGLRLPILRELSLKGKSSIIVNTNYSSPLWLNTNQGVVRRVRLYLKDALGKTPSLKRCFVKCTLLVWYKRYNNPSENG